ncbi:MAG: DMT family transporter [Candidatus Odinarchaeota archaeon]
MLATRHDYKAQSALLTAVILWGAAPVALEIVLDHLSPLRAITLRYGLATIILSLSVFLFKGKDGFALFRSKTCILLGLIQAFGLFAWATGQDATTSGLATLLASLFPVIVPFITWKLEGNKPRVKTILLALVALMGVFLIAFDGDWSNFSNLSTSVIGILISIAASFLFGLYIAVSSKYLNEGENGDGKIDSLDYLNATTFHVFLPLFLVSVVVGDVSFFLPREVINELLFLAIFTTIVTFGLYNWSVPKLGAVRSSFYMLLQVIIPIAFELIFWGQIYSYWIYGGMFILLSVFLLV